MKMTKIIGITGGKGGTGKSTVATALAYEIAKVKKVLLVDADVDCPNDHLLLSIERKELETVYQRIPKFNLNKCSRCGQCGAVCKTNAIVSIKNKEPLFMRTQCNGCGSCHYICKEKAISWEKKEIGKIYSGKNYNIDFLGGELKACEPVSEFIVNSLNEVLRKKANEYEYIIIDTAAGTHCPVIAALEMCDKVYSVTEPTPLGAHDLEIILGLLKALNTKSKIVINRSDIGNKKLISVLSEKYNVPIITEIPYSKEIINNYAKGIPINNIKIIDIIGDLNR